MKSYGHGETPNPPANSDESAAQSRSTVVTDILECCALACGARAAGVVAKFKHGSRLLERYGDPEACCALERSAPDWPAPSEASPHEFFEATDERYTFSVHASSSRFALVVVSDASPADRARRARLLELFARQLAPHLASPVLRASERGSDAPDRKQWRALELISEAVVGLDENLQFIYLNAAAEALFSRSREELIGQGAFEAFPPSAETRLAFERALYRDESSVLNDYSISIEAWLETRVFPMPDGVVAYIRDVSERQRQREKLRRSEERYRLLSAATNDALWEWDIGRNEIVWDDAVERITGFSSGELSDPSFWASRVHRDDVGRLIEGVAAARESGPMSSTIEYRFRHAAGHHIYLAVRGEMRRDEDGTPTHLLGGISDVTERHRLNARLMRTDRLETLGRLSSSIAHDLNNLLTPILLSLSAIQALQSDPEVAEELELIQSSVDQGSDLTRRLLTFARGSDGERKRIDLSKVAREVHKLLRRSMPATVSFELKIAPNLPMATCDPSQMHQVISNLCINARDAIDGEGEIIVALEPCSGGETFCGTVLPPGRYVCLSVTDTGEGIPTERLDEIFEPFFTTKPENQGTGLGLATVRSIVDSHDGFVGVSSDGETRFVVWIPADPYSPEGSPF